MRRLALIVLLFSHFIVSAQNKPGNLTGTYSDFITQLTLNPDSTFSLTTPDYVYPYTHQSYKTQGRWISDNNRVILNPDKEKRTPTVSVTEQFVPCADSLTFVINYQVEVYQNEVLTKQEARDFQVVTLYINRPKNYRHIVHSSMQTRCAFAPRIKKQYIAGASNIVKLPLQKVEKIGVNTYGFGNSIEVVPKSIRSNYFELTIVQPIDIERTPRSKEVIVKGKRAFFYETKGRVSTSGFSNGLTCAD